MEWLTLPVEFREIHWTVDLIAVALLLAVVGSLGWLFVKRAAGIPDGPLPGPAESEPAPSATRTPSASRGLDPTQVGGVDPGLSSVLGVGAPVFTPQPPATYDDETHTEHVDPDKDGDWISPGLKGPAPDPGEASEWSEQDTEQTAPTAED